MKVLAILLLTLLASCQVPLRTAARRTHDFGAMAIVCHHRLDWMDVAIFRPIRALMQRGHSDENQRCDDQPK